MDKFNILCVVGGISKNSLNQRLFQLMTEHAPMNVSLRPFAIHRLPFYSQDLEMDPPDTAVAWKDMIRQADAVLFITPEYNRSFPGVLKNAIDWGSRPYGANLWDAKPAGVMGASIGSIGTFGAQHHLRQVLAYLNMRVMAQPEFYFDAARALDAEGKVLNPSTETFIEEYWAAFVRWVEKFVEVPGLNAPTFSPGLEASPSSH